MLAGGHKDSGAVFDHVVLQVSQQQIPGLSHYRVALVFNSRDA